MSDFKKYQCMECEHIYDEEKGDPDSGIAPGTRWEDIPDDWDCPICGAPKSFFKLMAFNVKVRVVLLVDKGNRNPKRTMKHLT
jgi:rubredoxin